MPASSVSGGIARATAPARGWTVVEVFEDNDTSASNGKPRRAYERMLAAVEVGRIDAIVTWHNDCLHRSSKELEAFIDLVERTRVRLAVVTGGDYDLTTPDGRLAARIVGAVARKESEDRSRRVRRKHLECLLPDGPPELPQRPSTRARAVLAPRYRSVRVKLEREIDRLHATADAATRRRTILHPDPRAFWAEADFAQRREMLAVVVERVVVAPGRRVWGASTSHGCKWG